MKLIGAILIVSLVSVSSQESFNRAPLPYVHRARSHFIPLFYANGIPAGYDLIDTNKVISLKSILTFVLSYIF